MSECSSCVNVTSVTGPAHRAGPACRSRGVVALRSPLFDDESQGHGHRHRHAGLRPRRAVAGAEAAGSRAAVEHQRRVGRALCVAAVVVFGAFVAPRSAQPASRYALTAAFADRHTVDIGHYGPMLGVDRAVYDGRVRSDKGPGQPALAVPFYLAARIVGAPAIPAHPPVNGDLMLWWLTLTTSVVPFALLGALVYRRCARLAPRRALAVTAALLLGSIVLPPSVNLFAHALSALLGYAAYAVIVDRPCTRSRMLAGGFLAAAAVATEYQLVIVAAVVAVLALARAPKRFPLYALGALPPLAGLAIYQWRAFGSPARMPFAYYAGVLGGTTHGGYTWPRAAWLFDATLSDRGLLVTSPIVLVAVLAALLVAFGRPAARSEALVALVVFALYLALVAGWSGTPLLEDPGPRYLIAAIPFLAVPLACAWPRVRVLATIAAVWGGLLMLAAAVTSILVVRSDTPLRAYVDRVEHHRFLPTVWSLEVGQQGAWLWAASVALALYALVRTARGRNRHIRARVWIH